MIKTPVQDALEKYESHKYTLKLGQNKDFILNKDNAEAYCPKIAPLPVPNSVGGFGLMRMPCSTGCPFATLKHNVRKDKYVYHISCESGKTIELEIEDEAPTSDRPKLSLV